MMFAIGQSLQEIMMSGPSDRLREKTMIIASLNQKVSVLEAQLSGSHKRSTEMTEHIKELEGVIIERDTEIDRLRSALTRAEGALDRMGKDVQDMKAEQIQAMSKRTPVSEEASFQEQLAKSKRTIEALKEDLKRLSEAATAFLSGESESTQQLQEAVLEVGDPKYKILNIVLKKRKIRMDEIASILVSDMTEALQIVDSLQAAGEVEIRDGTTVIPGKKYREVEPPTEEWEKALPAEIFDSLEDIVGRTEGNESVARALESAVDILEQKISRGGALVFEMRKAVGTWKKQAGNVEELQYTIREWKSRASSLG
jgi:chromosome segregation ATPase